MKTPPANTLLPVKGFGLHVPRARVLYFGNCTVQDIDRLHCYTQAARSRYRLTVPSSCQIGYSVPCMVSLSLVGLLQKQPQHDEMKGGALYLGVCRQAVGIWECGVADPRKTERATLLLVQCALPGPDAPAWRTAHARRVPS